MTDPETAIQLRATAPRRKRPRFDFKLREEDYESQARRFNNGCAAAKVQLSSPFPTEEELEAQSEKLAADRASMNEAKDMISRAKRILYDMQAGNGQGIKQWDFKTEDVETGTVSLQTNWGRLQTVQDALEGCDKAFYSIQRAEASTAMDSAKEATLQWVAEERAHCTSGWLRSGQSRRQEALEAEQRDLH